jgi:hypothetical protein
MNNSRTPCFQLDSLHFVAQCNKFYFLFFNIGLQNLTISIVSYMGNLRVTAGIEKGFLDPQKFKSCVENAFEIIFKAADEIPM